MVINLSTGKGHCHSLSKKLEMLDACMKCMYLRFLFKRDFLKYNTEIILLNVLIVVRTV